MDIEKALTKAHTSTARIAGAISLCLASRAYDPARVRNWVRTLRHVANSLEADFLSPAPEAKVEDSPSPEVHS